MKDLKICYEVQGLAIDDEGNPVPAGLCLTLEGLTDENYDRAVKWISEADPTEVLPGFFGMDTLLKAHRPEDFRLISEEEYEEKYGEDDDET